MEHSWHQRLLRKNQQTSSYPFLRRPRASCSYIHKEQSDPPFSGLTSTKIISPGPGAAQSCFQCRLNSCLLPSTSLAKTSQLEVSHCYLNFYLCLSVMDFAEGFAVIPKTDFAFYLATHGKFTISNFSVSGEMPGVI